MAIGTVAGLKFNKKNHYNNNNNNNNNSVAKLVGRYLLIISNC